MPQDTQFKTHEDYLNWYREYRKNHRERIREQNRRWRKENNYSWNRNHKEKAIIQDILDRSVYKGIIKRKPCEKCGDKKVEGHHPDYSKPLKVIWLCKIHHKAIHKEEKLLKKLLKKLSK